MKRLTISFLAIVLTLLGGNAQNLYFPPSVGGTWETLPPSSLGWCNSEIDSLYDYLARNNTRAFILLKDGRIVLEQYFGGHTASTVWQWASAGKTITALLTGIAQQEGYLDINDAAADYLGAGWTDCTPAQEQEITIWHQLTMTSGLDDGVPDNHCTLDTCLVFRAAAGTRWAYHNAPYTLLDGVIANATGSTLNAYATQKLKNPTGMTGAFVSIGYNNVYFSNARSMARFGLLVLSRGVWNGNVVLADEAYFDQMISSSQQLNRAYGYLWWLNGQSSYMVPGSQLVLNGMLNPHAPVDMIAGMGKDGQLVNVVPSRGMVWVRMGSAPDEVPVPFLMNDKIWEYINRFDCTSTVSLDGRKGGASVSVYPNPVAEVLHWRYDGSAERVEVVDLNGRVLWAEEPQSPETVAVPVAALPAGVYVLRLLTSTGERLVTKWLKQ